jgi:hypothetical protein
MYLGFWFWLSVVLVLLLVVSLYYLWKFANIVLETQDSVESCLDILDNRYRAMSEILEIPIFFDSVEVRRCVDEIKKSRDAILVVANILSGPMNQDLVEVENKQLTQQGNQDGS